MKRSLLLKLGYNGYSFMGNLLIGDLLLRSRVKLCLSDLSIGVYASLSISCILVIPDREPALKIKLSHVDLPRRPPMILGCTRLSVSRQDCI